MGPTLKQRVTDGKTSAIINMSSQYADRPAVDLPIYSSAKSFGDVFSQNLWYEN
jgi:short-subunit dehydrogenase